MYTFTIPYSTIDPGTALRVDSGAVPPKPGSRFKRRFSLLLDVSFHDNKKHVDCMNTSCKFNSSRTCGYPGRLVIDADGNCEVEADRYHRDRFP